MTLLELVQKYVTPLQRKVRGAVLGELASELADRHTAIAAPDQLVPHVLRMKHIAEDKLAAVVGIDQHWQAFTRRYFRRADDRSRRQAIVDFLTETVRDPAARRADVAAIERFLDHDALHERYLIERHHLLVAVEIALAFIANAGIAALENAAARSQEIPVRELFDAGKLDDFFHALLETKLRWQLRHGALDGLRAFASHWRVRDREVLARLRHKHLGAAVRLATDPDDHPWVQGSALRLVLVLQPELGFDIVSKRLLDPSADPRDFLVRRQCVDALAADELLEDPRALDLLRKTLAHRDPSEHVRQGLADAFCRLRCVRELSQLAGLGEPEESPRVRAYAIRAACRSLRGASGEIDVAAAAGLVVRVLEHEAAALPLAVACEEVVAVVERGGEEAERISPRLIAALLAIAGHPRHAPATQEHAAAAAERIRRSARADERAWRDYLASVAAGIAPGRAWSIKLARLRELPPLPADPTFLGRILAELSRRDFPLAATRVEGKLVLWRGDRRRRRLWRILHELRSPRPNKRQAHRHTIGRQMKGHLRAAPGLMNEVTATVVPGERVHVGEDGGWGRHVPTIDDLLDLPVGSGDSVRIFSSFGITTIRPPASWLQRVRNRIALSLRYASLAALRITSLAGTEPHVRQRYADELFARYGIELTFERYDYDGTRALAPARLLQVFTAPVEEPARRMAEAS